MAESLLFVPDISGFTEFVNNTEVEHSKHIIAELLELIIDSDELGLTVAEIEGDAVLFYKEGEVASLVDLAKQAESMFVNFHAHLRKYESHRICECGACRTAHKLTLKVVAHCGPIEFLKVKGFNKPYGSDLILVHRLLKNDVPNSEYLLVSKYLADREGNIESVPEWVKLEEGESAYETIGPVRYLYAGLEELHSRVPEPEPAPHFALIAEPIVVEGEVEVDADTLFRVVGDFSERLSWNDEVDEFLFDPAEINRVGTKHQCIIDGKSIDFETVTADFGEDKLVYGERIEKPPIVEDAAFFYVLSPGGDRTHLRIEGHYHPRRFPFNLTTPLFRKGTRGLMAKSFQKIKAAAEQLAMQTA